MQIPMGCQERERKGKERGKGSRMICKAKARGDPHARPLVAQLGSSPAFCLPKPSSRSSIHPSHPPSTSISFARFLDGFVVLVQDEDRSRRRRRFGPILCMGPERIFFARSSPFRTASLDRWTCQYRHFYPSHLGFSTLGTFDPRRYRLHRLQQSHLSQLPTLFAIDQSRNSRL